MISFKIAHLGHIKSFVCVCNFYWGLLFASYIGNILRKMPQYINYSDLKDLMSNERRGFKALTNTMGV